VSFDIVETQIEPSPGGEEMVVRIELQLGEVEEEGDEHDRTEDHVWGGLGFIFCLALLSFRDAHPRGFSGVDFQEVDELGVADLVDCLRYERGCLRFDADYIRGRCVKTDIWLRADGTVTLRTRCRGEAATRWIQILKGKALLELVD
jgi:hypothetical protein